MGKMPGEVYTYDPTEDLQRDREDRNWKPEYAPQLPAGKEKVNPYDQFLGDPGGEGAQQFEQGEVPFGTRFKQHFINSARGGTAGIIEGARMYLERDPIQEEKFRNEAVALDKQFENLPASESLLDYTAAVGGSLAGGAADPMSAIPVVRVGTAAWQTGRTLLAPIINQAVSGAALNAVTNLADQGLEYMNDMRDHVDLWDTFIQTAVGAVAGTGFGGLQGIANKKAADQAAAFFEREALAQSMADAPEPGKAPRAPGGKGDVSREIGGESQGVAEPQDIRGSASAVAGSAGADQARAAAEELTFDLGSAQTVQIGDASLTYQVNEVAPTQPQPIVEEYDPTLIEPTTKGEAEAEGFDVSRPYFHGTSGATFSQFDPYGSEHGLFGSGQYFTEDSKVAQTYTAKGAKRKERQGEEVKKGVYAVYLKTKDTLDMDAPVDPKRWASIAEQYDIKIKEGMTAEEAYRELEQGIIDVHGEELPRYEGAEIAQDAIRSMGYDSITHIGGGRTGKDGPKHRVKIVFDPEQIKIVKNPNQPAPTTQVEITNIRTPVDQRRQGAAREALGAFLEKADQQGLPVKATAMPMDSMTHQEGASKLFTDQGFSREPEVAFSLARPAQKQLDAIVAEAKANGVRLDLSEKDNLIRLGMMKAAEQGEGRGSKALQELVDYADATGKRIALTPEKVGNTSVERLKAFYKRFGFKSNKGKSQDFAVSESMIREPKRSKAFSTRVQQGQAITNRPQQGISQPLAKPAERLEQIGTDLAALAGVPVRQGRLARAPAGKAIGQFDRTQGVMRLREMSDFETQTHEVAHALEGIHGQGLNAIKLAHRGELEPMAYPGAPAKQQLSEGFAEWFRFYLTTPLYAQRQAPNFTAAFEQYLSTVDPEKLKGFADVSRRFVDWTHTPSRAAVSADIVSQRRGSSLTEAVSEMRREGWRNSLGRYFDKTYTGMIDKLHPINRAVDELRKVHEKNTGQALEIKAANNPYIRARIAADSFSAGQMDLMHGVVPFNGTMPEGPGMADAMSVAFGDTWRSWDDALIQDFDAYLVSRMAIQRYAQWSAGEIPNTPGKFTLGDYQVAKDEFEVAHPEWVQAADMVYEYERNLLKKTFESGFIPSEVFADLNTRADYVPMLRDMSNFGEDRIATREGGGPQNLKQSIIRSFQGSKRAVLSPIEVIAQKTYRLNSLIQRNEVFKALDDLAQAAGPGGGAIVERIPSTQLKGVKVDINDAIRDSAKKSGLDEQDIDTLTALIDETLGDKAAATIFKAGEIGEKGEPIIYVWRNGKKQALRLADGEFGREMYNALTGMSKEMRNIFIETLALPSTILRYGITTHPPFLLANYLRDQLSAWIITGNGFIPFISGARGTFDELIQSDITRVYNTSMGIMGGAQVAALDKSRAMRDIRSLNKRGYAIKRFASWRGLAELTEITETGTRLAIFDNAYRRGKTEGLTDFEAMIEASYTSRDYIDFGRHGSQMYGARRLITFLNASLQGLDKSLRTLSGEGAWRKALTPYVLFRAGRPLSAGDKRNLANSAKAFAKMQTIGLFGLGLSYLYRDDPEYEEISDYLRATHWMIKDYGWLSDNIPGTQRVGNSGKWLAFPKPFDLAIFSNLYERSFESIYGKDEIAMQKFVSGIFDIAMPPTEIPLAQTYYEMKHNETESGRPIVPENLQGLDPELQFNAYTSWVGKKIGKLTGTSPMMIDHAIAGFGGSWGRSIMDTTRDIEQGRGILTSVADSMKRRFLRDVTRGSTSIAAFWQQIGRDGGRMVRVGESYAHLVKNAPGDAARYLEGKTDNEVTYAILNAHAEAAAKRLHPMRRAQDATLAISAMRKEIASGNLTMVESDDDAPEVITLTPDQRQFAQDTLGKIQMAEARNALITVGEPGWKQRDYIDTESLKHDLELGLPAVYEELLARYTKNQVYDDAAVREVWPDVKDRALTDRAEATFDDLVAGVK